MRKKIVNRIYQTGLVSFLAIAMTMQGVYAQEGDGSIAETISCNDTADAVETEIGEIILEQTVSDNETVSEDEAIEQPCNPVSENESEDIEDIPQEPLPDPFPVEETVSGDETVSENTPSVPMEEELSENVVGTISQNTETTCVPDNADKKKIYGNINDESLLYSFVLKQKVDIKPYFENIDGVKKIKIAPESKGMGSISKKGIFVSKKPGDIKIIALDAANAEIADVKFSIIAPKMKIGTVNFLDDIDANEKLTDTSIKPTSFKSSNKKIAIIDEETGIIKPLKNGTCKISAKYSYGTNTVSVTGTLKILQPKISPAKITITKGRTKQLTLKNTTETPVEWSSEDEEIASVDQTGLLTANGKGITTIHAIVHGCTYNRTVVVKGKGNSKAEQTFTVDLGDGKTTTIKGYYDMEQSEKILSLVNKYRKSKGKGELSTSSELNKTGLLRAYEVGYYFDHRRPNDDDCFSAFPRRGYAGENIAAGQSTAEQVFEAWKNSPGHNANMLDPGFKYAAMYLFITDQKNAADNGHWKYYWVQVFTE